MIVAIRACTDISESITLSACYKAIARDPRVSYTIAAIPRDGTTVGDSCALSITPDDKDVAALSPYETKLRTTPSLDNDERFTR